MTGQVGLGRSLFGGGDDQNGKDVAAASLDIVSLPIAFLLGIAPSRPSQ
jgi:hypothetical protein